MFHEPCRLSSERRVTPMKKNCNWPRWMLGLGVALLFSALTLNCGAAVTACTHARFNEAQDLGGCPKTCPPCDGMPVWWVSEPYENLWIADEPLSYYTSDGQKMSFRWTYQQRGQLTGGHRFRELSGGHGKTGVSSYGALMRYRNRGNQYMTNAAWCHNWWSEIVFWDDALEQTVIQTQQYPEKPSQPTAVFYSFGATYQAIAFLGDGGSVYFNGSTANTPNPQTKVKFQVIPLNAVTGDNPKAPFIQGGSLYPYPLTGNATFFVDEPRYGFRMILPDGSVNEYGFVLYNFMQGLNPCKFTIGGPAGSIGGEVIDPDCVGSPNSLTARAFLTRHIDPQGRVTRIGYQRTGSTDFAQPRYVVKAVVDPDGRETTYYYNTSDYNQLTSIVDPYGRTAYFGYENSSQVPNILPSRYLNSIQDAEGMQSKFAYQISTFTSIKTVVDGQGNVTYQTQTHTGPWSGWIESMETLYGTTRFAHFEEQEAGAGNAYQRRAILVSEPITKTESAHQLFLYRQDCTAIENEKVSSAVPTVAGWSFDSGNVLVSGNDHGSLDFRNSYHWDRRQFAAITHAPTAPVVSINNVLDLLTTPAEYKKARQKHWLRSSGSDQLVVTGLMSSEREPSPNATGNSEGARTFYAYPGQASGLAAFEGTSMQVGCVARKLPDGTSQYQLLNYNPAGNLLMQRESYTKPDGTIGVRTNSFGYYDGGINIQTVTNRNWFAAGLAYNASRQVEYVTNALGHFNKLTYQSQLSGAVGKLTGLDTVPGATAALTYYSHQAPEAEANRRFLRSVTWQPTQRTWSFGYDKGLVKAATNDLDLTMDFIWDGLNRLRKVTFPDTTYISNRYERLDLVGIQDRHEKWTHFGYNGLGKLTAITNAMGHETYLGRCSCGTLETITDALGNQTRFTHNNQGRLTQIDYPDASTVNYEYDTVGRVIKVKDSDTRFLTFTYNNQNLVTNIANTYGRVAGYIYDEKDRIIQMTDALGVTVTNQYDVLDRLVARFWPDHETRREGYLYETNGLICYTNRNLAETWLYRDKAGRVLRVTNANNEITHFGYDSANHLTSLTDALNRPTTWQYDIYGLVTNKIETISGATRDVLKYTYDPKGRLTNRLALATGDTAFSYDLVDNLTNVTYLSPNPDVVIKYEYDPLYRMTNMIDALGTTKFAYTDAGRLQSENGPWSDDTVSYTYENGLRKTLSLLRPGTTAWAQTYGYDDAWRLKTLEGPTEVGLFTYDYSLNSVVQPGSAVRKLTMPNAAYVANTFDGMGRLQTTALQRFGRTMDGATYTYDLIGLRTNIARDFGLTTSAAALIYDPIGQLKSWTAKEANGSTVRLNEQVGYAYDKAGNLQYRTNNDSILGFNVDELNRLTSLTRPFGNAFTYSGSTPTPGTSVSVNSVNGSYYNDGTFAVQGLTLNSPGNTPFNVSVNGSGGRSSTLNSTVTLPTPVNISHDNNGNMKGDGLRAFDYDWENQLTNITVSGAWKVDFAYDGLGRRRVMKEYGWTGSWGSPTNEVRYIYDGSLVIQERSSANAPLVTYTRGLDLSESRQGAGGIGGLLARTDSNGSLFYHADGAGNITTLLDANRNMAARYLYDPFGNLVGKWGSKAEANHYRFSSKEVHPNSGLYYYGFRFYEPNLQRWMNRDPLGEAGGLNLYGFVGNSPVGAIDPYGESWFSSDISQEEWDRESKKHGRPKRDPRSSRNEWDDALDRIGDDVATPGMFVDEGQWLDAADSSEEAGMIALTGAAIPELKAGQLAAAGMRLRRAECLVEAKAGANLADESAGAMKMADDALRGACFVDGTMVDTAAGLVEIEDIEPGDQVWSYDEQTGQWELAVVERTFAHPHEGDIISITVDGTRVEATDEHPFWVMADTSGRKPALETELPGAKRQSSGKWITARELRIGDKLQQKGGNVLIIEAMETNQIRAIVHNIQVLKNHNYTVGAFGVLVHNQGNSRIRPPSLTPPGAGRTGALHEALRRNGVPTSKQPDRILPNLDKRGNVRPGRVYEYDVPAPGGGTRTVKIRDDAGGDFYGTGNPQNRGSHFNDEVGNHYDY